MRRESLFSHKSIVRGVMVATLRHRRNDRGLKPAPWRTRCLLEGEIHEFILCPPSDDADPVFNEVSYLGFAKITHAGVVEIGDELRAGAEVIGTIRGFDDTHAPNHYNILVSSSDLRTGAERDLAESVEIAIL
jgi:hypothetical protein